MFLFVHVWNEPQDANNFSSFIKSPSEPDTTFGAMDANAVSDAEDSVTEEDFIPLDAKKPVVGVKKKKKKKRQANEGGRYESRSLDPKLQDRIRSYLEKNKHLVRITIDNSTSHIKTLSGKQTHLILFPGIH